MLIELPRFSPYGTEKSPNYTVALHSEGGNGSPPSQCFYLIKLFINFCEKYAYLTMRLYTKCSNCRSKLSFKENAPDRFVLAKKRGEKFKLNCHSCSKEVPIDLNDVKAEENKLLYTILLLLSVFATITILIYLWPYVFRTSWIYAIANLIGIVVIPHMFYQAYLIAQRNKVRYFNTKRYG